MTTIEQELSQLSLQLEELLKKWQTEDVELIIKKIEEVIRYVDNAHSHSWLGRQSLYYYKDFQLPQKNAFFSQVWGNYQGDWVLHESGQVGYFIYQMAGNPDMDQINKLTEETGKYFKEQKWKIEIILNI